MFLPSSIGVFLVSAAEILQRQISSSAPRALSSERYLWRLSSSLAFSMSRSEDNLQRRCEANNAAAGGVADEGYLLQLSKAVLKPLYGVLIVDRVGARTGCSKCYA